ncbi:MAG: PilZ domain-containing protein [Magnetococcales bacterium]|nr:PilZ domain-containing protein [Magnetococcales bacterium]NGZ25884.1 PilZ domain-containing protein [Magnetococcales bacterium]
MAEDSSKEQKVGMLKKFFSGGSEPTPTPAPASSSSGGRANDNIHRTTVKDIGQIKEIIELAVTNQATINVKIPGEKTPFATHFATNVAADFKTREGQLCLLVAPLDPPIGNLRMRSASFLYISFFTEYFTAEAKVHFLKNLEDRSIQLSFPTEIERGVQKRSSSRVRVDPKLNITCTIKRPAGFTYVVKLFDISSGGVAFYPEETIPPMTDNTKLILTISRPAQKDIELPCTTLGVMKRDDKTCFRAVFNHKGESQKEVDNFIMTLVEKVRAKRIKLFQ